MKGKKYGARRVLTFAMCVLTVTCLTSAAAAFLRSKDAETAPTMAPFSKNSQPGAVVTFSEDDFTSRISKGAALDGIVIDSLPDDEAGVLRIGGRDILRGEGVSLESVSSLRFIPADGNEASASFSFIPVFSDGAVIDESITVAVNLGEKSGSAPEAEDLSFETYQNIPLCGRFKASDPDGGELTYKIIDKPKMGSVKEMGDKFRYVPETDKHGEDSFTYVATDAEGNTSSPATVSVKITKRRAKDAVSYSDMDDDEAHFAAIRLSEMGIITGKKIGDCFFMEPDAPVTRGEFVAMAVTAADIAAPAAALNTGMDDDAEIAAWAKPYISAALNEGIVKGSVSPEGMRVFRADAPITRAEAAVVLNNISGFSDVGHTVSFADADAIPTWAVDAVSSLDAANVIKSGSELSPSAIVTRAEAAQLLYDTVTAMNNESSGSFSAWVSDRDA